MSSLRLAMKLSLQETGVSSGTLKKPLQETGISGGGDGSGGGKKKKKERGPGRRRRHPRQSGRKLLKNAPINAERSQDHQHDQIDFEGKSKLDQYRQNKWKEMFNYRSRSSTEVSSLTVSGSLGDKSKKALVAAAIVTSPAPTHP